MDDTRKQLTNYPPSSVKSSDADPTALGEVWIDEQDTIFLKLYRLAHGFRLSATISYTRSDKHYGKIARHLDGLKPGEHRIVQNSIIESVPEVSSAS